MSAIQNQTDTAYHVVLLTFAGAETAARVVEQVKIDCAEMHDCEVEAEAVITRIAAGKVSVSEQGGAGIGATLGVVAATLVGFVAGPIILPMMMVVGGVAGGIAGHYVGQSLPADDLREIGERLPLDSSAYLAIVDSEHAPALVKAFEERHPQVLDVAVETEMASAIREAITHRVARA
jgi:uncharacterized membrane protein